MAGLRPTVKVVDLPEVIDCGAMRLVDCRGVDYPGGVLSAWLSCLVHGSPRGPAVTAAGSASMDPTYERRVRERRP
jgi:hypothetical protein